MRALLVVLCLVCPGLGHLPAFYGAEHLLPLAVLADHPLSVARTVAQVPLIAVPQGQITMLNDVHISSVSPTQPLVTCKLPKYTLDATPAVRVVLEQPLLMGGPEAMVGFPSQVSVAHGGLRISLPVGALLAPVQEHSLASPHLVRVLYAIPTSPLFLRYPYFPQPFPQHIQEHYFPFRPSGTGGLTDVFGIGGEKKPSRPLVTVLDFPTELARPQSLYYQPPVESELGNRGPPEAVIPAGIVQSAQPRPLLTPFFNSKESPLLQSLRDEAEKHRLKSASEPLPDAPQVEAL